VDLRSDTPYWLIRDGYLSDYPPLRRDLRTDVLIVGGGITGALIGYRLALGGVDVAIVDRRHIGFGSTSASTCFLQYEIDVPLFELSRRIGVKDASRAYRLCADAIDDLASICDGITCAAEFRRQPSLWFASSARDVASTLEPEFAARRDAGFDVRLLDRDEVRAQFGFDAPAGLLSAVGASCDPFRLTDGLMRAIRRRGGNVYDQTTVEGWTAGPRRVEAVTREGFRISAKHLVVAAGYESQRWLDRKVTRFLSTYAIATKPIAEADCPRSALLWETRRPYLYLRATEDHRLLAGGRDVAFSDGRRRDRLIGAKGRALVSDLRKLFPSIDIALDFAWAGTFAETRDGLPYIGNAESRRVHFALGYGGNGITFSCVAADLIAAAVAGRKHPDRQIFDFDRR
jgi:glycine/D-amino acid oxidase-like deaminating enzyme